MRRKRADYPSHQQLVHIQDPNLPEGGKPYHGILQSEFSAGLDKAHTLLDLDRHLFIRLSNTSVSKRHSTKTLTNLLNTDSK